MVVCHLLYCFPKCGHCVAKLSYFIYCICFLHDNFPVNQTTIILKAGINNICLKDHKTVKSRYENDMTFGRKNSTT